MRSFARTSVLSLTIISLLAVVAGVRATMRNNQFPGIAEELLPANAEETLVPCVPEGEVSPDIQESLRQELDAAWVEAKKAAGKPDFKGERPKVCGRDGAVVVMMGGSVGMLCGYYEKKTNTALVVYDPMVCGPFRCVIIHEYLHAILGSGHKKHPAAMEAAGCTEEGKN